MIPINLLPHRAERRKAQQRQFFVLAATAVGVGALTVVLVHGVLSQRIESQEKRNRFLVTEIGELDKQIDEIKKLKEQTQAMLDRKKVVEALQTNRTEAVRLLDQLVRQLPDGLYLKSVKQNNETVNVTGYTTSNARVSTLMRNFDASPWLEEPKLVEIKAVRVGNANLNEFNVNVKLTRPKPDMAEQTSDPAPTDKKSRPKKKQGQERPMTLDELKRLNPREIGTWPVLPKIGVLLLLLVLILVGGYFLDWSAQWTKLTATRAKEAELRKEFLAKKAQAVNLDAYRKQLEDVQQSFGALLKQLPNKSEMEALLSDINQAGLGRGLQFELFKPNTQEVMTEFYAEQPIAVKLAGSYHDMGAFASDVSQLSRIVTLDNVALALDKEGRLTMEATARTFRYLDEDEVAAQKKASRDDKEKGKGKGKGKDKVAKKGGK